MLHLSGKGTFPRMCRIPGLLSLTKFNGTVVTSEVVAFAIRLYELLDTTSEDIPAKTPEEYKETIQRS